VAAQDSANPGQTRAEEDASVPPSSDRQQPPLVSADPLARYYRKRSASRPFSKKVAATAAVLVIIGIATAIVMTRRNSGDAAAAKPRPAPRANPDDAENRILGESQEADATRKTLRLHNTMVRVTRVEVGEVRGRDEKNQVITSEGKTFLHVYLHIQNVGSLPLEYHSWYGNAFEEAGTAQVAELRDDAGHAFDMMLFSDTRSIRGHVTQATLAPKQSMQDVLIFRLPEGDPLSNVNWLSLRLPALAHGDAGNYRFRIPRSMIVARDSTAQEPEASEASEPDMNGESEKSGAN
jgi:hypothetical protein